MKILQVSNKYPFPPNDGGTIAALAMAKGFLSADHEVSLLTMRTPKHGGKAVNDGEQSFYRQVVTVYVDTSIKPLPLIKNLCFSALPYNAERFINRNFRAQLEGILKTNDYDIVQVEGLYLMPYADTIRKHSSAKIALRAHNVEHEVWQRIALQAKDGFRRRYYRVLADRMEAFERSFIDSYDLLVPVSQRDLRIFNEIGNTKPSLVVPVGVEIPDYIQEVTGTGDGKVSFIGALDYIPNQEGLEWFIEEVWKKFLVSRHPFSLYVAGRNAPGYLRKYLDRQPLHYLGEVENAGQFMRSGGVLAVPVLSGGGIRVRILEAMAMGIPVVSTSLGAEGVDVSDGVNIMIADKPEIFANAIIKLLENQTFFANIGKNARSFIRDKMDSRKCTDALLTFYCDNL